MFPSIHIQSSAGLRLHRVRHSLVVHLLGLGPDPEAGELPGHGLAELGVGDRVHNGVETAGSLGWKCNDEEQGWKASSCE